MQNTYQDLITDIQSKNPEISGKLEGGKKFKIKSDFKPAIPCLDMKPKKVLELLLHHLCLKLP